MKWMTFEDFNRPRPIGMRSDPGLIVFAVGNGPKPIISLLGSAPIGSAIWDATGVPVIAGRILNALDQYRQQLFLPPGFYTWEGWAFGPTIGDDAIRKLNSKAKVMITLEPGFELVGLVRDASAIDLASVGVGAYSILLGPDHCQLHIGEVAHILRDGIIDQGTF